MIKGMTQQVADETGNVFVSEADTCLSPAVLKGQEWLL